ncbi:MAG: hypothetical protein Fur0027_19660 [Raineya sp.]
MKRIKYNSGGQPFRNSDFALQQTEIYKAIENQFADTNGFVFSGGVVTGNSISPALVYLDGKIRELAGATGLTFPCYIKASTVIEYDSRLHSEDNNNKTTKQEYKAEIVNSVPSGDYITVSASGVDKRLVIQTKNAANQYSVSGFEQNAGKVSYVEVKKTTNQVVPGNTNVAIGFTSEIDDLNEFDVATGEFVAQNAGIYSFHATVRTDLAGEGFSITLQFWNGSAWDIIAESLRNVVAMQGNITVSCVKKLSAGQRVRIRYYSFGGSSKIIQGAYASIARVG